VLPAGMKQFHLSDDDSKIMPGTKYNIYVNSEGKKVHLQKWLMLCNLKDA
jgi:hypothetical protein